MLTKNAAPILEFDDAPEAKLNPANFVTEKFQTDKLVITRPAPSPRSSRPPLSSGRSGRASPGRWRPWSRPAPGDRGRGSRPDTAGPSLKKIYRGDVFGAAISEADEAFFDDLEEMLILADVGLTTGAP